MDLSCKNQASLRGRAGGTASPSHTNHGVTYYLFPLEVDRLSGTLDTLNVVVSEDLLAACPVIPGEEYQVTGEVRSFNNRSGVGSRLVITLPRGSTPTSWSWWASSANCRWSAGPLWAGRSATFSWLSTAVMAGPTTYPASPGAPLPAPAASWRWATPST